MINPYLASPCDRCGGKRKVAKTWKETMYTGFEGKAVEVEYSQIICLDKDCQKKFEATLEVETQKRLAVRKKKEENDALRKLNMEKARKIKKSKKNAF